MSYFNRTVNSNPLSTLGSDNRKKEYDKKGWKYDDTIKGFNRDGSKIENSLKPKAKSLEFGSTGLNKQQGKTSDFSGLSKGVQSVSSIDNSLVTKPDVTETKAPGGADVLGKAIGGLGMVSSLLKKDTPDIDTSGKTDYSSVSNKDVTGGISKTATDTLGMAAQGLAIGGPLGALVGGIAGLGKNLIGGGKAKRELAVAKGKNEDLKRYKSSLEIDNMSNGNNDVLTEDNIEYIKGISSPSYQRFKRNKTYNV